MVPKLHYINRFTHRQQSRTCKPVSVSHSLSSRRYSCMTQSVREPCGARPRQYTKVFFTPTARLCEFTFLSFPVAFQYPDFVARFVLDPFGYLRSRGLKKYHSRSLLGRNDFSEHLIKRDVRRYTKIYCIDAKIYLHRYVIIIIYQNSKISQDIDYQRIRPRSLYILEAVHFISSA